MRWIRSLLGPAALATWVAVAAGQVSGQEGQDGKPLALTVHPSGFARETLDQKLERRLRESDYLFRHICRGCGRGDAAAAAGPSAPFNPQATLDGARRRPPAPKVAAPAAPAESPERPEPETNVATQPAPCPEGGEACPTATVAGR